jgi:hypothetical protein
MLQDLKQKLYNKKIIVICPKYFGYEKKIVQRLNELNTKVTYIDERPANSTCTKTLIRIFPFLYRLQINSYYNKKLKTITTSDKVLVINPESLSIKILNSLKRTTRASEYILYMWDSFSNKRSAKKLISFFDRVLTFDPLDAKKLAITFRPLFFCLGKRNVNIKKNIAISFVGTGHSDRAKIISAIKENDNQDIKQNYFYYLYLQTPLLYYYNKLTNSNFKKMPKNIFHFVPIKYDEYEQIVESSKAFIDIEHPAQTGLTIRTFEMLGKEIKLITTNANIKGYDFYNEANILVIDRTNPVIDMDFISTAYQPLPVELYYKYSIDGWLEDVFA